MKSSNWQIELIDGLKTPTDPTHKTTVGEFDIVTMENTKISFQPGDKGAIENRAFDTAGKPIADLNAGFTLNGKIYRSPAGWHTPKSRTRMTSWQACASTAEEKSRLKPTSSIAGRDSPVSTMSGRTLSENSKQMA